MLKKLLSFIPGKASMPTKRRYTLTIIPRDQHTISRQFISEPAKKVLHRLNKAGFEAYLVGGGVRDLLLGLRPKDFDIATNATPEEVHDLFRNSRLIGRRFKIVHVLFGREVIEVTTFRGTASDSDAEMTNGPSMNTAACYGTTFSAARKKTPCAGTSRSMRFTTVSRTLLSTITPMALSDLEERQLRLIGDPETRYREDPVRMLRAVRFAAKLGFDDRRGYRRPHSRTGSPARPYSARPPVRGSAQTVYRRPWGSNL